MNTTTFLAFETFDQFWERIQLLFQEGKTTGPNQSEAMIHYTQMSITRTKRGLKHYEISAELQQAVKTTKATNWLLITEAWCGDASNTVPVIALAATINPAIQLRVMVRDEHPDLMQNYLTNGSKSIPILVVMDDMGNELGKWGPRPAVCQELVITSKQNPTITQEELMSSIQKWYIQDATVSTQAELSNCFLYNLN